MTDVFNEIDNNLRGKHQTQHHSQVRTYSDVPLGPKHDMAHLLLQEEDEDDSRVKEPQAGNELEPALALFVFGLVALHNRDFSENRNSNQAVDDDYKDGRAKDGSLSVQVD